MDDSRNLNKNFDRTAYACAYIEFYKKDSVAAAIKLKIYLLLRNPYY